MPTLNFKGKTFVQNHHLSVPYHQLVPIKEKSLTDKVSLHDNLIIHGDNLKALKALLPTFAGKVKCICIDPPYNTGNEGWVYNDNVNSPYIKEWLGKVVDKDDLTRHDKWLCMMTPRLKLLRELLSEDGVIFVFIDDIEQHRLRLLMDEVFGEENFVNVFAWQSRTSKQNDTDISSNHEYILAYARKRRIEDRRLKESNVRTWFYIKEFAYYPLPLDIEKFSNPDNDARGLWKADPFDAPDVRENLTYAIKNPNTKKKYYPPDGRHWRTEETNYKDLLKDNRILFGKSGDTGPQLKVFYEEKKMFGQVDTTWWEGNEKGTTTSATKMLQNIFLKPLSFEHPKPIEVVQALLSISTKPGDIILDSFAGSGTTAHAIICMNNSSIAENRKFILIEMEDYADSITAERVRRVIKGVKRSEDTNLQKGMTGKFSFFNLGDSIEHESILHGKKMPSYKELARYVFYTATGEEFDERKVQKDKNFIGKTKDYDIYMYYEPDIEKLKKMSFTLDMAEGLPKSTKRRLVFAPTKFIDNESLDSLKIDFCQLPFEIYRLKK